MIEHNISLKPYNTFGIDVKAKAFGRFKSVDELKDLLQNRLSKVGIETPLFVLGGGSNILLTQDLPFFVLKNEISGIEIINETETSVVLKVGSGVEWHSFVRYTVEKGWGGVENLSLIPGSVGASPMQNIGAYGAELKDTFVSLEALHIDSAEIHTFNKEQCQFGYRESVFKRALKNQYVIVSVSYKLSKNPKINTTYGAIQSEIEKLGVNEITVEAVSQAVMNIRRSKLPDPKVLGNAGSFFKNPVVSKSVFEQILKNYPDVPHYPQEQGEEKLAAGWLIEKAGWKGKRIGNCGVHEKQALVLVNYGGASGQEIYDLSALIIADIESKFGVSLEREVNIF
ncbi:MAG: UDP-N-acetylenolpyruvoylglucosamine reductase [Fluviicola sp.]|jgi:UDP-N-acetylmuramate dehydrogenase|uniref:UDP-N-acetylmuramate dehydrogenase n=1 Tax=Fluviicola sp. TaxID=1917219 RepID=UPI00262D6A3B|nr:UDP-N-acetylmuramate dehydrogenase [Fluviicola sp.]MDF3029114.1 UDP-N-acetylenolpyruvoylglucosamine reductase [Fluviicola sp.]